MKLFTYITLILSTIIVICYYNPFIDKKVSLVENTIHTKKTTTLPRLNQQLEKYKQDSQHKKTDIKPVVDETGFDLSEIVKQALSSGQTSPELDETLIEILEQYPNSHDQLGSTLIETYFYYDQLNETNYTQTHDYLIETLENFWPEQWLDYQKQQLLAADSDQHIQKHLNYINQWLDHASIESVALQTMTDSLPLSELLTDKLLNTDSLTIAEQIISILHKSDLLWDDDQLQQLAELHDNIKVKHLLNEMIQTL